MIRGTNSFTEETGVYRWTCVWNHEPGRLGGGDAIGVCADSAEVPASFVITFIP